MSIFNMIIIDMEIEINNNYLLMKMKNLFK